MRGEATLPRRSADNGAAPFEQEDVARRAVHPAEALATADKLKTGLLVQPDTGLEGGYAGVDAVAIDPGDGRPVLGPKRSNGDGRSGGAHEKQPSFGSPADPIDVGK